jgi:PIN domain nuclease of toxin-antitoxin system
VRALLDTQTLLWWILDDSAVTHTAGKMIAEPGNTMVVSSASAWELAIKFRMGKLPEATDLVLNFPGEIEHEGFQLLPIFAERWIGAGLLSGLHEDPFDRMLIAQCQAENIPNISTDLIFERYGVRRLW